MKVDVSRRFPLRSEGEKSGMNCPIPNIIVLLLGRIWWEEIFCAYLQAKDTSLFKAYSQENCLGDNLEASLFNPVN